MDQRIQTETNVLKNNIMMGSNTRPFDLEPHLLRTDPTGSCSEKLVMDILERTRHELSLEKHYASGHEYSNISSNASSLILAG